MGPTRAPASVSPNVFIQIFSSNCSSPNPTNCWPISFLSKRATSLSSSKDIVTGWNFGGHIPVLSTQPTSSEPEINSSTTAMSGCSTDASMVFRKSKLFFAKMSGTSASIQFQRLLITFFIHKTFRPKTKLRCTVLKSLLHVCWLVPVDGFIQRIRKARNKCPNSTIFWTNPSLLQGMPRVCFSHMPDFAAEGLEQDGTILSTSSCCKCWPDTNTPRCKQVEGSKEFVDWSSLAPFGRAVGAL